MQSHGLSKHLGMPAEHEAALLAFGQAAFEAGVAEERAANQRWWDAVERQHKAELAAARRSAIKQTLSGSAVVDAAYHWIAIEDRVPPNGKVQLINRHLGVAVYGNYAPKAGWTHWAPLPTFQQRCEKTTG